MVKANMNDAAKKLTELESGRGRQVAMGNMKEILSDFLKNFDITEIFVMWMRANKR